MLAEYDQTGTRTQRYAYLPNQTLPTQVQDANGIYTIHGDHLNTPCLLTDSNQIVVWQSTHQAFGATTPNDDADGNGTPTIFNMRFPGQYYDQESGLHYNHYRYYDPKVGRYITRDPIGLEGGINVYGYVGNNPLKRIDPRGLFEVCVEDPENPLGNDTCGNDLWDYEVVGRHSIRLECESYFECIVRCELTVVAGEAASRAALIGLKELADRLAKKHAAKLIPIAGWISTGVSAGQGIRCFADCK